MRNKLDSIIKESERCAKQNETDARNRSTSDDDYESPSAGIVASEQRRMLKILKACRKDCK